MGSSSKGRVDTIDNFNYDSYKLFDEKAGSRDFNLEAIKGIHTKNELSDIFFSRTNIDALQEAIRYLVYKKSCGKYVISKQSETELKLIMRAYYLEQGNHRQYDTLTEIKELNTLVLNYAVPRVLQEIQMYDTYKDNIGKNPIPMDRGSFVSSKGTRTLVNDKLGL